MPRTNYPPTDDVGFLLAKASAHFNELLLERFAAAGYPEIRGSFGSVREMMTPSAAPVSST